MRFHKLLMLAGLAVASVAGAASADPSWSRGGQVRYQPGYVVSSEPAIGTYQDGYVWVGGAYEHFDGANVWVPAHWQIVADAAPAYGVRYDAGFRVHRDRDDRFRDRDDRFRDRDDRFRRGDDQFRDRDDRSRRGDDRSGGHRWQPRGRR